MDKATKKKIRKDFDSMQGVGLLEAQDQGLVGEEAETFANRWAYEIVAGHFATSAECVEAVVCGEAA